MNDALITENAKRLPIHSRRLELPNGKGWVELRGEFNPFDLDKDQRELLTMLADLFRAFDQRFGERPIDTATPGVVVSPSLHGSTTQQSSETGGIVSDPQEAIKEQNEG